ncbi:hypothetical protein [Gemmobacter sp.]|uniref:hypothetical protein n=1 Tax=Gemmobacter sp. TaxID=1898957 RepID=UPI002AFFDAF6|nr:hypothetical protein [Gemmobacter sp.]
MIKYVLLVVLGIGITACGAQPSPEFFGADRTEIAQDGRSYTVFRKADRFQVIRVGYAARAEQDKVRETMLAVVDQVTGCTVKPASVQGDSVELRGSVSCP